MKTTAPVPCSRCGTTEDVGPVTWRLEAEDGSIKEVVEILCHDCDDAESAELAHEAGDEEGN